MRFHWGWLEPVMTVPYVPTLGPVRRDDPLCDLFEAVVEVAGTGRFLPHDKDARWFDSKAEYVLADAIEHDQYQTLIPTLHEGGARTVKVHVYGTTGLSAGADLARKLAALHGAGRAKVTWFLGPDQPDAYAYGVGTRVQFKDFTDGPGPAADAPVLDYKELPEPERFAVFAERMAGDGFAFLYEGMRAGAVGPVLTVVDGGTIAGAIGPMETISDAVGRARLLPQYFGVLPEYRCAGYGRTLWRAAMHWGHQHGAAYQLLQTEAGGASDRLCSTEGLTSLGFVNQTEA
ncbi:GNAT family N-acetyltransferase [Streptomyces gilvifuscus]|uniref:GNAT family N-acetyltransferase n=1 Tax=Streptomyces gilvifuscus TaxID=1550617 RepID=A0ABT5G9A0_9ACTN|nr:GNAT family N-acetyltransferase [Streptomyces gilvifuscus]MDC2961470.1 GNAT family N-acetyltransferase [Streptomyces gilvifuscus]